MSTNRSKFLKSQQRMFNRLQQAGILPPDEPAKPAPEPKLNLPLRTSHIKSGMKCYIEPIPIDDELLKGQ